MFRKRCTSVISHGSVRAVHGHDSAVRAVLGHGHHPANPLQAKRRRSPRISEQLTCFGGTFAGRQLKVQLVGACRTHEPSVHDQPQPATRTHITGCDVEVGERVLQDPFRFAHPEWCVALARRVRHRQHHRIDHERQKHALI